ncbi:hypothetical protein QN277_023185 [Acacia crassicarpa]|uniref:Uncharacterized protein n=1 Tax=Acacia crassicarpa TaxID=499986 RepID=A0AAE1JGS0_9FABA|nr:hypothetical protein QN277_023185 [Acacia crassicarpa]
MSCVCRHTHWEYIR